MAQDSLEKYFITQVALKFSIILPHPPESLYYMHVSPSLAQMHEFETVDVAQLSTVLGALPGDPDSVFTPTHNEQLTTSSNSSSRRLDIHF